MLISGLKAWGCSRLGATVIMLQLCEERSQLEMLLWMYEHQEATPSQLLRQSSIISKQEERRREKGTDI